MKKILTLVLFFAFYLNGHAVIENQLHWSKQFNSNPDVSALASDVKTMGLDEFLSLTPKKYEELTGEKLGLKKTVQLKAAQKFMKKSLNKEPEFEKGLYILLAILGLAWIAMGVMDDWSGNDWIVNLILTVLCWLPGLIHALTKMKKYYG